jgi:hypothetical protein
MIRAIAMCLETGKSIVGSGLTEQEARKDAYKRLTEWLMVYGKEQTKA